MSWSKWDDGVYDHPKKHAVANTGLGLIVSIVSRCHRYQTGGHLTISDAVRLASEDRQVLTDLGCQVPSDFEERLVKRLVETGWLDEQPDGSYRVHNFDRYAKDADFAAKSREKAAARQARYEARKRQNLTSGLTSEKTSSDAPPVPVPVPLSSVSPLRSDTDSNPSSLRSEGLSRPNADASLGDRTPADTQRPARKGARKPPREDMATSALTDAQRAAYEALRADADLAGIVTRPAALAVDLVAIAPGVDVALEVTRAGAWLRANPKKRKANGNAFLARWVTSAQERHGGRGTGASRYPQRPQTATGMPVQRSEGPIATLAEVQARNTAILAKYGTLDFNKLPKAEPLDMSWLDEVAQ